MTESSSARLLRAARDFVGADLAGRDRGAAAEAAVRAVLADFGGDVGAASAALQQAVADVQASPVVGTARLDF